MATIGDGDGSRVGEAERVPTALNGMTLGSDIGVSGDKLLRASGRIH